MTIITQITVINYNNNIIVSMSAIITLLSFYYGSEQCFSIGSGQVEKMKTEGFHLKIEFASQLILDMLYMYILYIILYIYTQIFILYVNICLCNICITYYIYIMYVNLIYKKRTHTHLCVDRMCTWTLLEPSFFDDF